MENLRTYEEFDQFNLKKIEKLIKIYQFINDIKFIQNLVYGTEVKWKLYQYKWIRIIFNFLNKEEIINKLKEIEKNRDNDELIDKNLDYIRKEFKKETNYPFDLKEEINKINSYSNYIFIDRENRKKLIDVLNFLAKTKISEDDPYGEEDWSK